MHKRLLQGYYIVIAMFGGLVLWIMLSDALVLPTQAFNDGKDRVIGLLSNVHANFFNPQGEKLYRIESKTLKYIVSGDSVNSGEVNLYYSTSDKERIIITSEAAEAFSGGQFVKLVGATHIERFAEDFSIQEIVDTADLLINTKDRRAVSNAPTKVRKGKQEVQGEGLEVDLQTGKIKLLKNVKVKHVE